MFNVIGLFSMFAEKPWVRIYHIIYTSILVGLLLLSGALIPYFPGILLGLAMALWAGYWFKSKRVAKTYCVVRATESI